MRKKAFLASSAFCNVTTVVNIICAMWDVQCAKIAEFSQLCALWGVVHLVCGLQYEVQCLQFAVFAVCVVCSVQCTVCSVQFAVCCVLFAVSIWRVCSDCSVLFAVGSVQCAVCVLCSVQCAVYCLQCAIWGSLFAVFSVQCLQFAVFAVFSVQFGLWAPCAVYSVQWTACNMRFNICTVCSVLFAVSAWRGTEWRSATYIQAGHWLIYCPFQYVIISTDGQKSKVLIRNIIFSCPWIGWIE